MRRCERKGVKGAKWKSKKKGRKKVWNEKGKKKTKERIVMNDWLTVWTKMEWNKIEHIHLLISFSGQTNELVNTKVAISYLVLNRLMTRKQIPICVKSTTKTFLMKFILTLRFSKEWTLVSYIRTGCPCGCCCWYMVMAGEAGASVVPGGNCCGCDVYTTVEYVDGVPVWRGDGYMSITG